MNVGEKRKEESTTLQHNEKHNWMTGAWVLEHYIGPGY